MAAIVATDEPGMAARTRPTLTASPPRAGVTAFKRDARGVRREHAQERHGRSG